MDRVALNRINPDVYQDILEDSIYDNMDSVVNLERGHAKSLHVGLTDKEMVERIILEGKKNVSSFYDLETLKDSIADIICFKAKEISSWITKRRYEFDTQNAYHYLPLELKMGGEAIGHGFDQNLNELKSDYLVAVLKRDYDDDSPYGFFLMTAYVDISPEHAILTGRVYPKESIIGDPTFLKENKWEKLLYFAKEHYKEFSPRLIDYNGKKELKLSKYLSADTILKAFISDSGFVIEQRQNLKHRRLSLADCYFKSEEFGKAICAVEQFKENFMHERSQQKNNDEISLS